MTISASLFYEVSKMGSKSVQSMILQSQIFSPFQNKVGKKINPPPKNLHPSQFNLKLTFEFFIIFMDFKLSKQPSVVPV